MAWNQGGRSPVRANLCQQEICRTPQRYRASAALGANDEVAAPLGPTHPRDLLGFGEGSIDLLAHCAGVARRAAGVQHGADAPSRRRLHYARRNGSPQLSVSAPFVVVALRGIII